MNLQILSLIAIAVSCYFGFNNWLVNDMEKRTGAFEQPGARKFMRLFGIPIALVTLAIHSPKDLLLWIPCVGAGLSQFKSYELTMLRWWTLRVILLWAVYQMAMMYLTVTWLLDNALYISQLLFKILGQ